jgi:hypothetical protein
MSNKFSEERRDPGTGCWQGWEVALGRCGLRVVGVWSVKRGTPRGWGKVRGIMRGAGFW